METLEGIVDVNSFKINNKQELIKNFEEYASYFLFYRKHITIDPHQPIKAKLFMRYTTEWYNFIRNVTSTYKVTPKTVYSFFTQYEVLQKELELPIVTVEKEEYITTKWGPRIWKFLHYTSIMIQHNKELIMTFACLMLNFDLFILCGVCKDSFKKKEPLSTILMRIKHGNDPITVLFNFHNMVNATLHKPLINILEFDEIYNVKHYFLKRIPYKETINIAK